MKGKYKYEEGIDVYYYIPSDIKKDELQVYGFICKQIDFLVLLRRLLIDIFANSQARTVQKYQLLCSQNWRKSAHVYR